MADKIGNHDFEMSENVPEEKVEGAKELLEGGNIEKVVHPSGLSIVVGIHIAAGYSFRSFVRVL